MPNDPEGGKLAEQTADRQAHPAPLPSCAALFL